MEVNNYSGEKRGLTVADWTPNAKAVLEKQYLRKNEEGQVCETPDGMLIRVANHVSQDDAEYFDRFLGIMDRLEFLPNTPTLMNAGTRLGQLSACLSGDTIVRACGGDFTIKDLAEEYADKQEERFNVWSADDGNMVVGRAFAPRMARSNAKLYKVLFDDGSYVKATSDHLIMESNGNYKEVGELACGDSVTLYRFSVGERIGIGVIGHGDIVGIEYCGIEDVYDLSVERYHNFVANNVFVHNCFVLPIEDNISAIFEAVKQSALIHKSGGGCFERGTRVKVNYWKSKPIEEFEIGDAILTYSPGEDKFEEGQVTAAFKPDVSNKRKVKLKFEDFEIVTTEDHPFGVILEGKFCLVNAIDLSSDMDIVDFGDYCPMCGDKKPKPWLKTCSIECSYKFRSLDKTIRYGEGYHKEISRIMKSSPLATCPSEMRHWTMRGYSEEEAKRIISNIQKGNSSVSVQYYLNKGMSEGKAKEAQANYQRSVSKRCLEYWMAKGFNEEEARVMVGKSQTRDLSFFVQKYGDDGDRIYQDYILNKVPTLPEFWIRRGYSESEAVDKAIEQSEIRHKGVVVEFESVVKKEMEKLGIQFEHQKAFNCNGNGLKYIGNQFYICVDFYIPSIDLVVEADAYEWLDMQSERDNFLWDKYKLKVLRIRRWKFEEDVEKLKSEVCDAIAK